MHRNTNKVLIEFPVTLPIRPRKSVTDLADEKKQQQTNKIRGTETGSLQFLASLVWILIQEMG